MSQRIEDYALVGDTHTAALVGRDGSMDWLCLPRFDSGACFAALLGDEKHGRWRIGPVSEDGPAPHATSRRYRGDTLVLETTFSDAAGEVRLIDFLPIREETPLVGFLPPDDPRVVGTIDAIQKDLRQDGFVMRYRPDEHSADGLPHGEGAFLPCTFWLVDALEQTGRRKEAREIFERLLSIRNDVGLLAEEYDPANHRMLGNFPQAFTHVALVNSASNLTPERPGTTAHRTEKATGPTEGAAPTPGQARKRTTERGPKQAPERASKDAGRQVAKGGRPQAGAPAGASRRGAVKEPKRPQPKAKG